MNESRERDPEIRLAKEGNQWHFGMKVQIGVDADCGLVDTVVGTAANASDVTVAGELLRVEAKSAFGDAGYRGVGKREEAKGPTWQVAMQPGKHRALDPHCKPTRLLEKTEQLMAGMGA